MDWIGTPNFASLMDLVDPYAYRDRYTIPKFIVNSTGDEFFLPDSSQFYYDALPGEKHLRYVPNTDHSLDDSDAPESLLAFYLAILTDTPRPQFSWTLEDDGSIHVQTVDSPNEVKLWQATNPSARDFRKDTIGAAYADSILTDQGGGLYVAQVPEPPSGWTAFFVELTYDSGGPVPFKFTTEVRVLPEPTTLSLGVVNETRGSVDVDPNLPKYYDPNTVVTLTAQPLPGETFKNWKVYDPNHPGDANHIVKDSNLVLHLPMHSTWEVSAVFQCGLGIGGALPMLVIGLCVLGLASRRLRARW
jgi:hypothetical protein